MSAQIKGGLQSVSQNRDTLLGLKVFDFFMDFWSKRVGMPNFGEGGLIFFWLQISEWVD